MVAQTVLRFETHFTQEFVLQSISSGGGHVAKAAYPPKPAKAQPPATQVAAEAQSAAPQALAQSGTVGTRVNTLA